MLVLISFGLVLVATVLLVLGLVAGGTSLALIYVSIACSLVAGIVLVVATVIRRPREEAAAPSRPQAPREEPAPSFADQRPVPEPSPESTAPVSAVRAAPTYTPARRQPAMASVATGGGAGDDGDFDGAAGPVAQSGDDDVFPIEDYDQLRVTEILPLLAELDDDELEEVEARERSRKGRVRVLNRIEEVRTERPADQTEVVTTPGDDGDGDAPFPIADYDELTVGDIIPLLPQLYEDELDVVEARERAGRGRVSIINRIAEIREEMGATDDDTAASLAAEAPPASDDDATDDDEEEFFPIADYDELTVGEILPLLPELYDDELDVVEERERSTLGRAAILNRLAELREQGMTSEERRERTPGAVSPPARGSEEEECCPRAGGGGGGGGGGVGGGAGVWAGEL
ncbi:MAG: hypothetical protein KY450_10615, partial [Actinobacteria bacterium]|nr:hypothetical protein [Actinomycetota bacterium]